MSPLKLRIQGSQDTPDGSSGSAGKDYVLYTDTEGDMNEWIKVNSTVPFAQL